MRTIYTTIGTLLTLTALAACKRELPPSASRPARPAAISQGIPKKVPAEKLLAEFYDISELGEGVNYIDPNDKEKDIWTRYPSGLMFRQLKVAEGEIARVGQSVSIAYVGTLYFGGKEFDRRAADNPLTFRLGSKSLIKGFSMGISTMKVGSKRRIFVPPDLGYGPAGNPMGGIGPNQPLVFDIELLSVTGQAISLAPDFEMPQPLGPSLPATTTSAPAAN